ncbi:unnamed protein product [Hymenolepis diminuta]|uniref:Integrase catalytic domain-containing protein n=1 Tax=Hymenolepis diminuta TaxID=6216 RepID=A0A0R3SMF2_HYMDI|nr:unnamed protein product [Hymenolepis diminuta]
MVDYFTKWATVRPIAQADTKSVAQVFFAGWMADHSVPYRTHTNRGTQLEKRTNRILKSLPRLQLERFEQNQWDVVLPTCLLAYRAAVHASRGQTPAFLMCRWKM